MKIQSLLLGAALFLIAFQAQGAETAPLPTALPHGSSSQNSHFRNIGVAEFEKLRTNTNNVVLDVRTPTEFASGHMPGAININVNAPDFTNKVAKLDPHKTYLVHCAAGVRSAKACDKLGQLQFGQLYNLEGGIRAWENAGHKPEK